VRLAGVVCQLQVEPADFRGWGVWRPLSHRLARLIRPATLAERQRYLELFPRLTLILCRRERDGWLAMAGRPGDGRFCLPGPVPVLLVEEGQPFDVIEARYDGLRFWFEGLDLRSDPATAAYLRQALQEMMEPGQLRRCGLTPEEREAYALSFEAILETRRDRTEDRLRRALAHGGAELRGYVEREDCYRVEYVVAGERHVSVVSREDLSVQVAGICLSGEDARFDLHSLVGVLHEAQDGAVVRVGADNQGLAEEHYWRVHPPRADGDGPR
jgi:hypothetical protein